MSLRLHLLPPLRGKVSEGQVRGLLPVCDVRENPSSGATRHFSLKGRRKPRNSDQPTKERLMTSLNGNPNAGRIEARIGNRQTLKRKPFTRTRS